MKKTQIIVGLLVIVILIAIGAYYTANAPSTTPVRDTVSSQTGTQNTNPSTVVPGLVATQYITKNINTLSPVEPAEGKTFLVSKMQTSSATGTIYYSDSVNEYIADFSFSVDGEKPTVTNFKLRK